MKWQTMMISAKTGKNCTEPRNTISKATSQWIGGNKCIENVEELREAIGSTRSVEEEDEEDENEQEMVPRLTKLYKK